MATLLVDKKDQLFVLKEMLNIEKLCKFPQFEDHTEFDMVLSEAHRFAKSEFYPTAEEGNTKGCIFDPKTNTVKFPECYRKPYEKFREGGWLSMCDSPESGGDGFPLTIGTAVSELFYAAGFYIYGTAELSHAGAKVIEKYGTDAQKALYMTRLFSGEWMGTMCLTEPDAGSDVGQIQTTAVEEPDGSYCLTGTKIFISAGEHDLTKNIIHMVLARIDGDPPGTKGLSLFIVPKFKTDNDGQIEERNDVVCTGIEKKMGLHGFVTCTMSFGDKGQCTGYLLGKRGNGITEMFNMMNEQRLLVGLQGLSYSSAAFLHAVDYTQTRKQGQSVDPEKKDIGGRVPIIEHPDIKRMLLTMKSQVDGGRALAYYTSFSMDMACVSTGKEKAKWQGITELLTPIVKAYLTNNSWEMTGMAIQCAGGYGYCSEYPFERLARDCKVSSLYEGTNGIQAMDLVFRKLIGNNCKNFAELLKQIETTIQVAHQIEAIKPYAVTIGSLKDELAKLLDQFITEKKLGDTLSLYAKATPFLEAMGDVLLGWLHLWQMTIAYEKLQAFGGEETILKSTRNKKDEAFYFGKLNCAKFYIDTLLKVTKGKIDALTVAQTPITKSFNNSFTG